MTRTLALLLALAPMTAPAPVQAQELSLERVFASPSLSGPAPRLPTLSPDGRYLALLRPRADDLDRFDLWLIDAESGAARLLADGDALGADGAISEEEKMRRERLRIGGLKGIVAYEWTPAGDALLVPAGGDLYRVDLAGNILRLTATPGTELDGRISETGRYLSYIRDRAFYVRDLSPAADGSERALARSASEAESWGVAEFVAQEEMGRRIGTWWSPDDQYVALARVDESGVKEVVRTAIGADGTRVYTQRYPQAGTPNANVELYILTPDGKTRTKVDLGSDPDFYLARADWAKDGRTLYVQRESRDQQRLDLLSVDPATGAARLVDRQVSKTWIRLNNNLKPLKDGSLVWTRETTGFAHLYRWHGKAWQPLTRGDWEVRNLLGVDEAKRRVYFTSTKDDPDAGHIYVANLDRLTEPKRLTETGFDNEAEMDKAAQHLLVTRSSPDQPKQVYLANAEGKRLAWLEENKLDGSHAYAPFLASHRTPQFGSLPAADGTLLPYKMTMPALEPGRRYPVFTIVYGGPSGGQVLKNWADPVQQYLVDQGYIVFAVDGRGTPRRGRAWLDRIHGKLGGIEVADQLAGLAWLKRQPYVDPARVSVYGWSYGGYMVLKMLEAAPGQYAAGIAGAPVTRWDLYDTHYTERYLGNPLSDPAAFKAAGTLDDVNKIADPLLVIHGMADDNVVFENTTALVAKLQAANKRFELMVYPGATHAINGEARKVHLWSTIEDFLARRMPIGQ